MKNYQVITKTFCHLSGKIFLEHHYVQVQGSEMALERAEMLAMNDRRERGYLSENISVVASR